MFKRVLRGDLFAFSLRKRTGNFVSTALSGFFATIILGAAARLISLATAAYLARILGIDVFGKVGFAEATITYFMLVSDLGLQTIGIRETSKKSENPTIVGHLVQNIVSIQLGVVAFFILAINLFVWSIYSTELISKQLLSLYAICLLLPYVFSIEWWLNGTKRLVLTAIGRLLREIIFVLLLIGFLHNPQQVLRVPIIQGVAAALIAGLICFLFIRETNSNVGIRYNRIEWHSLLRAAWPIGISGLIGHFWLRSGTIFLAFLSTDAEVGAYTAAWKLLIVGIEFQSVLSLAIFPWFASNFNAAPKQFKRIHRIYFFITLAISALILLFCLLFVRVFVLALYGEEFANSVLILQFLLFSLAIWFLSSSFSTALLATGFEKLILVQSICGALSNFLLNLALIPLYDATGAAISYLVSVFVSFALSVWFYYRYIYSSVQLQENS